MKANIRNLCNHLSRKPLDWEDVDNTPEAAVRLAEAEIAALPRFTIPKEGRPMDRFSGERPQVFVAVLANGQEFVVNTEGYDYARYVGRLNLLEDAPPLERSIPTQVEKLIRGHGEAAVMFTAALRSALAEERIEEAIGNVLQVSELHDDGHGLNFLIELEDGWHRVIITSP